MVRTLAAAVVFLVLVAPVRADRVAPIASPAERALRVTVVVVGKVTGVEKEPVEAPLYPGAPNKVPHKIAVVKIESNVIGADGVTHLKVGFVPSGTKGIRAGRGPDNPELAEGQEWLFFLVKHADGTFHSIPYMTPPVSAKVEGYKEQLERVKSIAATIADPAKALKAEKADDRFQAAVALICKYRTVPEGTREVETAPLSADESKLILKALAEGKWDADGTGNRLNGMTAFFQLGLAEADGWKPQRDPEIDRAPAVHRENFLKWLDGPGKDYRIKKIVPKGK